MTQRFAFTQGRIDAIKPNATRFIVWDSRNRGLGLRIMPSGTRSFVFAYRFNRRPRMLTLGNTPPLSLEQATSEYAKAKAKIAQARHIMIHDAVEPPIDLDPAATKRAKREARRVAPTFEDVWDSYAEKRLCAARPRTRKEYDRIMKAYVIPALGQRKIVEIRPRDLKAMLNDVEARGKVMANRTRALVASVFGFAADQFIIDVNPAKLVKRVARETARDRALKEESELRGFMAGVDEMECDPRVKMALLLILSTAARPQEVTSMRWSDIDLDTKIWMLPADLTKTGDARAIPLSAFAVGQIRAAEALRTDDVFVFGGARKNTPMHRGKVSVEVQQHCELFAKHGVTPFRPHDLRRTARTWLARLGVEESIAERVLGHVWGSKVMRVYDRHAYVDEMRGALEILGAHLTAMRAGPNVRALRAAA
jgi:integrase